MTRRRRVIRYASFTFFLGIHLFVYIYSSFGSPDTLRISDTIVHERLSEKVALTEIGLHETSSEQHVYERVSMRDKLWHYIQTGEFKYIFQKLLPYWVDIAIFLLFLLFIFILLRVRTNHKQALFLVRGTLIFILISKLILLQFKGKVVDGNSKELVGSGFFLQELKMNDENYGISIWADESRISAKYFIFNKCYDRYLEWKNVAKQTPLYACAASYAADIGREAADGLTIENGKIINKFINKRLDGLVTIDKKGSIRIYDLKTEPIEINGKMLDIIDPIFSQVFIDWAERNSVSAFQVHLLANNGCITIDKDHASPKVDLRRLLALVSDGRKNHIVLFNIPCYLSLAEAAEDIYRYITVYKKNRIIKLVNLDTGYYDAIEVIDKGGVTIPEIIGFRPLNQVANLFCIYETR